jgi:hypothetical protein
MADGDQRTAFIRRAVARAMSSEFNGLERAILTSIFASKFGFAV